VLDRLFALETFGIKLGLENISRLCAALGNPERQFASLHIAGTNGKGSVTAMTHAALRAAGVRAARYTSPHLVALNERFVIGDTPVDTPTLEAVAAYVLDVIDRMIANGELAAPPTFFEATTAIAFELFRRAGIGVAVLEVGLGGRFDATNVVTPIAGAITSIALDHQQHLGDTIRAIAFEKAGIIKPGMKVVIGPLASEARTAIEEVAHDRGATIVVARSDTQVAVDMADGRARLTLDTPFHRYGPLELALRGEHQVENAIVAVRLLECARQAGIALTAAAIAQGLAGADWPARLEVIAVGPSKLLLIDAAHNVEGATALARYLQRWHPERPPLVVGMMADKDVDGILRVLLPVTSEVFATSARIRRALPPEDLRRRILAIDPERHAVVDSDPLAAIDRAHTQSPLVCVAGSIYLAGTVRDGLRQRAILD
jgi:dihydrofolate synthase/folylpolyglutamate synthase